MKEIKIPVCGPPHSGKTVFVTELRRRLLPLGIVAVFEGCPDGEGGWAGVTDQSLVGGLRVKGKFTSEFVDWVIDSIEVAPMPINLIDVGGIRSDENRRIFEASTHFIVLANPAKEGEMQAWNDFGQANGCKPLALIESILHGTTELATDQGDGIVRGVQAELERGTKVTGPLMDAIVDRLLAEIGETAAPGELEADVHTGRLADELGIPSEERDARLGFRPHHAARISAIFLEVYQQTTCRLWGACPSWLAGQVVAGAETTTELWDVRKGWVTIPELCVSDAGSDHLTWKITEADGRTVVSFVIPGQVFDPAKLDAVVVPTVPVGAHVVLSGRGPHWLTAAIARAYDRRGHEVAILSPHESDLPQADGSRWVDAHPGTVPAVVINGSFLGEVVGVPVDAAKV